MVIIGKFNILSQTRRQNNGQKKAGQIREYLEDMFEKIEKDIEKELGVKFKVGNISYSNEYATIKLEASDIGEDGVALSKEEISFQKLAEFYGLRATDLGKTFKSMGSTYKIVGLKPRSSKYPILVQKGGATYKMDAEAVKKALEV